MANWDNKFKKKYPPTDKKKRRQQHLVRWRRGEKNFLKRRNDFYMRYLRQSNPSDCVWRGEEASSPASLRGLLGVPVRLGQLPCGAQQFFFSPLSSSPNTSPQHRREIFVYYYILFFSPPQRQNGFKKTIRTIREAKTRRGEKDTKTHRKKGGRKRARSVVTGKGKDAINNPALV